MATSYSSSLRLSLIGNGEQAGTWGTVTNNNWNMIEQSVAGTATISMANANYTLSNPNGTVGEAHAAVLYVTGTNSAIYQIVAPLVQKTYIVYNNTIVSQDTLFMTLGVTLAATDVVRVNSTASNVAFQLFGSEIY